MLVIVIVNVKNKEIKNCSITKKKNCKRSNRLFASTFQRKRSPHGHLISVSVWIRKSITTEFVLSLLIILIQFCPRASFPQGLS